MTLRSSYLGELGLLPTARSRDRARVLSPQLSGGSVSRLLSSLLRVLMFQITLTWRLPCGEGVSTLRFTDEETEAETG